MFQSPIGNTDDRTCTECGRNPSLSLEAPPARQAAPGVPDAVPPQGGSGRSSERGRHTVRKRRSSYFMFGLLAGWGLLVGLIIVGARLLWPEGRDGAQTGHRQAAASHQSTEAEITELNEAAPICTGVLSGFLNAGTPEERNQFVLDPITTAARMARFYELNPIVNIDPATIANTGGTLLALPGRRAIETQWEGADNLRLDAVFIEKNGEWRLDWDHFARYSDYPWALFLTGSGPSEGEFRLLARERLAKERKNENTVSVVLYAPRFGHSGESGSQSPEFLIRRDTRDGKLLDAAFALQRNGGRPFGVKLKSNNPDGFIRLRVKVRRVEQDGVRRFELEKVVACHWYSTDEPGVEITETPAEK
ncbi:hypothetical protein GCM10023212_42800 [Luteolibacter yonseiensis]